MWTQTSIKAPISILHNGIYYYFYGWDIDIIGKRIDDRTCIRYGIWTKDKSVVQSFTYEEVMQIKPWNFDENVYI